MFTSTDKKKFTNNNNNNTNTITNKNTNSTNNKKRAMMMKRACLFVVLLIAFCLPALINIEHRARKHNRKNENENRFGTEGKSSTNKLSFKTRERNRFENAREQDLWWREAKDGFEKVFQRIFVHENNGADDEAGDDEITRRAEVYKPLKIGHQLAKKTHERVLGRDLGKGFRSGGSSDGGGDGSDGEFNLDKAIAEEMGKEDEDDEVGNGKAKAWKGEVPVTRGQKTCEFCSNRGACLSQGTKCQCPAIYEGERCENLRDFVDHPRVMKGFKKAFEGSALLAKANTKNSMPLMVRRNPGQPAHPGSDKAMVTEIGKLTRQSRVHLPDEDPLGSVVFETCAIVGSSGILLKHSHGADIDSHDVVFRFNSATTKGFEKSVGAKTTHRITNSRNYGFREYDSECVVQHMRNEMSLVKMFKKRAKYPGLNLYGVHPQLHGWVDKSFSFLVTSGLFGALIAAHKCASVDLYGFQVSRHHGVQYHYYNAADEPANEERDGDEWLAVKSLVESGILRFADPCIIECHDSARECLTCQEQSGDAEVHLNHHGGGAESSISISSGSSSSSSSNNHMKKKLQSGKKQNVHNGGGHNFHEEFEETASNREDEEEDEEKGSSSHDTTNIDDGFTH